MWSAFSDEMTGLSFTIAAGPHERSHSRVLVPWGSRPYFTVSDWEFPLCRLLRLAGLRWRYSIPPPHGLTTARVRVTLRLAVYRQSVCLGAEPLETHGQNSFSQLNTCGHSPYITSHLTRAWICHLQLLLALASAFILGSELRGISLFVASYDSQGYGESIRPRLQSQSQSYVTTDGQSASLSWNKAPTWGLRPDLYFCMTVAGFLKWGALSLTRGRVCRLTVTVSSNNCAVSDRAEQSRN
jgi:hypothetical protein